MTMSGGDVLEFHDVVVSPYTQLLDTPTGGATHQGGPAWPEWQAQVSSRHRRAGAPIDLEPEPAEPGVTLDGPLYWGGPIVDHFGHQLAEFSMRLLPTLVADPDATVAFASHPRFGLTRLEDAPLFVRQIHDWVGLAPERTLFLTEPVSVRRLRVAPQSEQLQGPGPSEAHLDDLDALVQERLGPQRGGSGVVYVSRARLPFKIAGEAYLERALEAAGARIVHPETIPLAAQLEAYVRADVVIFSEGAAVHTTQLLGRSLGDVVVLKRRPDKRIAAESVAPRARSLAYHAAFVGVLCPVGPSRRREFSNGLALQAEGPLLVRLGRSLPRLATVWRSEAFTEARDADVLSWCESTLDRDVMAHPETWASMREVLDRPGVQHLWQQVAEMMRTRAIQVPDRAGR